MNDNLDERKSGISQPAPMQDDNNRGDRDITVRDFNNDNSQNCRGLSVCVHQGEGDNGDINIDVS